MGTDAKQTPWGHSGSDVNEAAQLRRANSELVTERDRLKQELQAIAEKSWSPLCADSAAEEMSASARQALEFGKKIAATFAAESGAGAKISDAEAESLLSTQAELVAALRELLDVELTMDVWDRIEHEKKFDRARLAIARTAVKP